MAAKSAEKKSPKKSAPLQSTSAPSEPLSDEVLAVKLHRALVRIGEAARAPEITRELEESSVNSALVRRVMEAHPRQFVAVDRRWDIAGRYLDAQRPQEQTLEEIIASYGAAIPITDVVRELSHIYGLSTDHYEEVAPRLLRGPRFFAVSDGLAYGQRSWLLDVSSDNEEDVLFFNYLNEEAVAPFRSAAEEADWVNDPLGSSCRLLAASNGLPVDNRIIQFFAWKALEDDFDPAALYNHLHASQDVLLELPNHRWLLADALDSLRATWADQSSQSADLAPEEPIIEAEIRAPVKPLEISEDDINDILGYMASREGYVSVSELLVNVLEVPATSSSFSDDAERLRAELLARSTQFLWVGADRFRNPDSLPPYLGQIPESLTFPVLPRFETADGEILDQSLDPSAFSENLEEETLRPEAQDINDEESSSRVLWPEQSGQTPARARLVLKAHHKEIGTFPLAQIPPNFLPAEPEIAEITLVDSQGTKHDIYLDNNIRLIYGLFDVYSEIAAESGAVLELEQTEHPAVFSLSVSDDLDPGAFVSSARMEELLAQRSDVESRAVSTYDIIRTILTHYRKGISFQTLLTETNVVRRTKRNLLASILSGYHAFYLRANRWNFDPQREPEGFDRSKSGALLR